MFESLSILLVIVLVLANGFFVASEFSLVGVRKTRIETLAATGDKRGIRLMTLLNDLNAYISATQLGITTSSLALGWIDGMLTVRDANKHLNLDLPEESDYKTVAGYLSALSGTLLTIGDTLETETCTFRIESVERHRVRRILMRTK